MSPAAKTWLVRGCAAVAFLVVLVVIARSVYFIPRAAIEADIQEKRDAIDRYEVGLMKAEAARNELAERVKSTLGARREVVDHELRTRVNRLAEACGYDGASVSTESTRYLDSPMKTAMPRRGIWKELRSEPDFAEVSGAITANGTVAQAVELIARLHAEPWPILIQSIRLDPKKNGSTMTVQIAFRTWFLPGRGGNAPLAEPFDPAAPGHPDHVNAILALGTSNPFAIPDPPAPPPAPPPDRKPQGFPWDQWRITGVAQGPFGREVWLRNKKSGDERVLQVGGVIGKATVVTIDVESATFELNSKQFTGRIGGSLAEARRNG